MQHKSSGVAAILAAWPLNKSGVAAIVAAWPLNIQLLHM
jgi:hypothetical protein